jgi:hypothetical protein
LGCLCGFSLWLYHRYAVFACSTFPNPVVALLAIIRSAGVVTSGLRVNQASSPR